MLNLLWTLIKYAPHPIILILVNDRFCQNTSVDEDIKHWGSYLCLNMNYEYKANKVD